MNDNAPTASAKAGALEKYAPYVVGLLLALPVLIARYPPMTDLPLHESLVGILRRFGDTSMFPPGLYVHNLGEPNQLFHMAAWALSYAVPTDTACKIVVAATVFAIPVCAARFATYVGANRLAALVVAPIALGWLFSWGLIANLIGLAVLLLALPLLDKLAESPTPKRAIYAIGGAVALYFAHEAMMFVYAGAALLFTICHPLTVRGTALRVVPFVASAVIAVAQAKYQVRFTTPAVAGVPSLWKGVDEKLAHVPDILFHSSELAVQLAFFGLFLLVLVIFLVLRFQERRALPPVPLRPFTLRGTVRPFLHRYRFELFAASCFAAYLTFPFTLNGATLVYERFFAPACAVFAVVAAPKDLGTRSARIVKFVAPVLPIAALLIAWPSFADADRGYKELDTLMPLIEKGSAVAEFDVGPGDPTRDFSMGSAAGRILAERGGRLLYAFTDSAVAPAFLNKEYQWNKSLIRGAANPWDFIPEHDLKRYRYIVFRTTNPITSDSVKLALAPFADVRGEAGEFTLFESKQEVLPLLSPDDTEDPPRTMRTLQSLVMRIEKRLRRQVVRDGADDSAGNGAVRPAPDHT